MLESFEKRPKFISEFFLCVASSFGAGFVRKREVVRLLGLGTCFMHRKSCKECFLEII